MKSATASEGEDEAQPILFEADEDDPRLLQLKGRKKAYDGNEKTATGYLYQTMQNRWLSK